MPEISLSDEFNEWVVEDEAPSFADVESYLDDAFSLRVDAIGETITDIYRYVEPLGRSAKEPVISWKADSEDVFCGGINAVSHHLEAVVASSRLISSETAISKVRYVQKPFYNKVFSLVEGDASVDPLKYDAAELGSITTGTDVTLVVDYGHGFIPDSEMAKRVLGNSSFLALTVQANSYNWGFNVANKWKHDGLEVDYLVLDEAELRLNYQDSKSSIHTLTLRLAEDFRCRMVAITSGHRGCIVLERDFEIGVPVVVPAIVDHALDRIGAGDAFLAVTAPLVKVGAPPNVIAVVGNVAGAIQVGTVGNSSPVTMEELHEWLRELLV
jgi:hypothetical protein